VKKTMTIQFPCLLFQIVQVQLLAVSYPLLMMMMMKNNNNNFHPNENIEWHCLQLELISIKFN